MTESQTVARPVRFFPASDGKGKWHAAYKVSERAVCGTAATLAADGSEWIMPMVGDAWTRVHPIVCRKCLTLTTAAGYSPRGTF